jgi:hypothetical protein
MPAGDAHFDARSRGPAACEKIVQSIVDADTAPAKVASFERLVRKTDISSDPVQRRRQLDDNRGFGYGCTQTCGRLSCRMF